MLDHVGEMTNVTWGEGKSVGRLQRW